MSCLFSLHENILRFKQDKHGVVGLPMRLTISIIIGTVALFTIISFIMSPCLFPSKMIITIYPLTNTIPGDDPFPLNPPITVYVNTSEGHPIKGATVLIKGLSGAGSGSTDENGKCVIPITVTLASGLHEGYLDVSVKAPCHESFSQDDMIKIVRSS
ncbi:MAG: Ig-like domain-containing protein [Euryarchaeota archaeon]|nr:Ig-like domain-containing protein [Euryarchaeota archaeon]